MIAKKFNCIVTHSEWISAQFLRLRFTPSRDFDFSPGQFVSVYIPAVGSKEASEKRCYSLANSPEQARREGYELLIKIVPGGKGTEFMAGLQPGDHFKIQAPFGEFVVRSTEEVSRDLCFVATGTGIAPFQAMIQSLQAAQYPGKITLLYGARTLVELGLARSLAGVNIFVVPVLSGPEIYWAGERGHVTDYLNNLPPSWPWHKTDFYLCGNPQMTAEVYSLLTGARGVDPRRVYRENFASLGVTGVPKTKPTTKKVA